jgi:hypothetical protein
MAVETPKDTDPASWHRYFAIENNNRAWELAGMPARTDEESLEMLDTAHAAALHWGKVGTELNGMRAKLLLAEAHALVNYGQSSLALAEEVRSYFLNRETDDWEIAFVHTIHAHAASAAGDGQRHRDSYQAAESSIAAIAEDTDREVVLMTFVQVPIPQK